MKQYRPQEEQTNERDNTVEEKLQYHDVLSFRERQRKHAHQRAPAIATVQGDEAPEEVEEVQFLREGQFGADGA